MTEPQTITVSHLRSLLDEAGDAVLVLSEGRVEVADGHAAEGAYAVVTTADLVDRLGANPSDDQLSAEAEALTVAVQQIGG